MAPLHCDEPCTTTTDPVVFVREVEQSVGAARQVQVQGRRPIFVVGVRGAFDSRWEVVSVYLMLERAPDGKGPPRRWWIASRSEADGAHLTPPEWADTRSCPALGNAIAEVETVSSVDVPLAGNSYLLAPLKYVADGTLATLWSDQARQSGAWPAQVTMSAFGGPLADWGNAMLKSTQTCWSKEQPA